MIVGGPRPGSKSGRLTGDSVTVVTVDQTVRLWLVRAGTWPGTIAEVGRSSRPARSCRRGSLLVGRPLMSGRVVKLAEVAAEGGPRSLSWLDPLSPWVDDFRMDRRRETMTETKYYS